MVGSNDQVRVTDDCSDTLVTPYCGNGIILGADKDEADAMANIVEEKLGAFGFSIHEEVEATTRFEVLGVTFDGLLCEVILTSKRITRLLQVIGCFVEFRSVSGKQVEKIVGHLTYISLLKRSFLSILSASYRFIRAN